MATHVHAHDHGHGHGHEDHEHHVVSPKTYFGVFMGLMVLLVITLLAAYFDLGALNLPIAMLIAIAKVVLIMTFFMHLKWNSILVRFFALGSLAFVLIMFVFTFADYFSRHWIR